TAQIAGARGGAVRFSALLDGLRQTELHLDVHGQAVKAPPPTIELRVTPVGVPDRLTPPAARSWVTAAAEKRLGPDLRRLLARAIRAELTYARKRQYDMFLASPDPTGPGAATYVYRTAALPRVSPLAGAGHD